MPAIVTLAIPAKAKRVHAPGCRKCRAEYAKVLSIDVINGPKLTAITNKAYTPHLTYTVGKNVYPDSFDGSDIECSHGINFFLTKIEAINY